MNFDKEGVERLLGKPSGGVVPDLYLVRYVAGVVRRERERLAPFLPTGAWERIVDQDLDDLVSASKGRKPA